MCTHHHTHIPHTHTTHIQRLGVVFRPRRVGLLWGVAAGEFNAVISHQVANYGMGGQYEPHFDFSRVRPQSRVFLEGCVWFEKVGASRSISASSMSSLFHLPPRKGETLLLMKQSPVEPGCFLLMWGVFDPLIRQKISLGPCENFSGLIPPPCVLAGVPFVALSHVPAILQKAHLPSPDSFGPSPLGGG